MHLKSVLLLSSYIPEIYSSPNNDGGYSINHRNHFNKLKMTNTIITCKLDNIIYMFMTGGAYKLAVDINKIEYIFDVCISFREGNIFFPTIDNDYRNLLNKQPYLLFNNLSFMSLPDSFSGKEGYDIIANDFGGLTGIFNISFISNGDFPLHILTPENIDKLKEQLKKYVIVGAYFNETYNVDFNKLLQTMYVYEKEEIIVL